MRVAWPPPASPRRQKELWSVALSVALVLFAVGGAHAELSEQGNLFVSFKGSITPNALPRSTPAPVAVRIAGTIRAFNKDAPPPLRRISIAINRHGHLDARGLPRCRPSQIEFTSSAAALSACRDALVGEGSFAAAVAFSQQTPFPSHGRLLAFNAVRGGQPVVLAHIYGTQPAPTTHLLTFAIRRTQGTFGTTLTASVPSIAGDWGYVKQLSLTLRRRFTYRGAVHSYLSASCAAPPGFPRASFPFARASMSFPGDRTLSTVLNRSCTVR